MKVEIAKLSLDDLILELEKVILSIKANRENTDQDWEKNQLERIESLISAINEVKRKNTLGQFATFGQAHTN